MEIVKQKTFSKWLDTFIEEKGIDLDQGFELISNTGVHHYMTLGVVIEAIKAAPLTEQKAIKLEIVKLDFVNAKIEKYLIHLAQALI